MSIMGKLCGVTSISTSRSSSCPSVSIARSFSRERWRRSSSAVAAFSALAWPVEPTTNTEEPSRSAFSAFSAGVGGIGGSSRSSRRSSARCSAWG